jgi:hypothetical protein
MVLDVSYLYHEIVSISPCLRCDCDDACAKTDERKVLLSEVQQKQDRFISASEIGCTRRDETEQRRVLSSQVYAWG